MVQDGMWVVFIEAKALKSRSKEKLRDNKAAVQQLQTYCLAHPSRPRWGALTNGRDWIIYDSNAGGSVFERIVVELDIRKEPMLLRLLSPSESSRLEQFANHLVEARQVDSSVIRDAAVRELRRELVAALSVGSSPVPAPASERKAKSRQPMSMPAPSGREAGNTVTWATSSSLPPSGVKPITLELRGNQQPISSWTEVLFKTASLLQKEGALVVPFRMPKSRSRQITASKPDGMTRPQKVADGVFVELNLSARDCVRLSGELLKAAGHDPGLLRVCHTAPAK